MNCRPEMRRTMMLSEQLSKPDPAIRDFLGVPHDDGDEDRSPSTLMDAIGRDESGSGGIINWKPLRDRLRLRRIASAWTTTTPSPKPAAAASTNGASGGSDRSSKYNYSPGEAAAAFSRTFSRSPSLRATPTFSRATSTRVDPTSAMTSSRSAVDDGDEEGDYDDENEDEGRDDEEPAAKMSLMALLEQTDNQWDEEEEDDVDGAPPKNSLAGVGDDDEDDGEAWEEEEMVHVCCVCMVRHKGAAFIPCGHTFCRLCSRELWVSRGNCPLCNGFIQEILDIF